MNLDNIILDICNYEYEDFLRKANVQGVGLGYKTINGCTTLEKVIQVYVDRKISKDCLSNEDLIPTYYKGIKTDVIETGVFTAGNDLSEISNGLTARVRPVTGGYSIGPSRVDIAATYGALVTDGQKYYMLGNNHALARNNSLHLGHPILQPGVKDGGRIADDTIAILSKYVPIKPKTFFYTPTNYVDCAIAEVLTPGTVSADITFIGKPNGIIDARLGLEVQAACKTSTYIKTKIFATGVTVVIKVEQLGSALFKDQIIIDYPGKGGNSGALVMTFENHAVGMIMSGSINKSTCNPIKAVLDSLDVTLVY